MSLAKMPEVRAVLRPVLRWTHAKKFWLIEAIKAGVITVDAAMRLHRISAAELDRWKELQRRHGTLALRSTTIQKYRAADDQG